MFGKRILGGVICLNIVLVVAFICIAHVEDVTSETNSSDYAALMALAKYWGNTPKNWTGRDPCSLRWDGITCNKDSHIVSITLSSVNLKGRLTADLALLSELHTLDLSSNKELTGPLPSNIGKLSKLVNLILSGCSFSGRIPEAVGSLQQLVILSLNSNQFTGKIPASIGKLRNLYWLDLGDNRLTGNIPVSNGTKPGLDLLVKTKHFHFGMNNLYGSIPSKLFHPDMEVIHVLFDNNNLTGEIPSTLGLVQALEAICFDRNSLSGPLPTNLNNLTNVSALVLSHNAFTGPVPDLTGMEYLNLVDLSNNNFDPSEVPDWLSTISTLTTVSMESTGLEGQLPGDFFNIPQLEIALLKNNNINGTLSISSSFSDRLQLIDLKNNSIESVAVATGYNFTLKLADNPFCRENTRLNLSQCKNQNQDNSFYSTTSNSCVLPDCSSDQISSPNCKCSYPYTGLLIFRAPFFSVLETQSFKNLEQSLLNFFWDVKLPVDSVSLSEVHEDAFGNLYMHLSIFPDGQDYFNTTSIVSIGFMLGNQAYKPTQEYGPYNFVTDGYKYVEGKNKSSRKGINLGVIIGGFSLLLVSLFVGGYAYQQKKRAEREKRKDKYLVLGDTRGTGSQVPRLKGARYFSFEELQKYTNNFAEANIIGAGGYGKVYRGFLPDRQIVAIKRSGEESIQGNQEFRNEIELLSRVHHKNLVNLIGFCLDKGEQMLVYEFVPNGTLLDSLSGKSGIQLDWIRRLMIALSSGRGLQYLHELADPPVIHRDVKSTNILLDERLNAKVSDFGVSKLYCDLDKGYVTTQVKGTMGYLDPEYFMTSQLTEKSDVFSFGVVMLEIVTAKRSIQNGKYILREIIKTMDVTKDLYNLNEIIDPFLISSVTTLVGLEKFVDLALQCTNDAGVDRPTMSEVVKEIENIVKLAGMNTNTESATDSQSHEEGGNLDPYSDYSQFFSGSDRSQKHGMD